MRRRLGQINENMNLKAENLRLRRGGAVDHRPTMEEIDAEMERHRRKSLERLQ